MKTIALLFKRLWVLYLRFTGIIAAYIGLIDGYTPEHRQYLTSGYTCGNCGARLIRKVLLPDVRILDAEGQEVSILKARAKGKKFQCPKCSYSWKFRKELDSK